MSAARPLPVYHAWLGHDGLYLKDAEVGWRKFTSGPAAEYALRHNGGGVIVYAVDLKGNVVDQVVCERVAGDHAIAGVRRAA